MKKAILASLAITLACATAAAPAFGDTLYTSGSSTYDNAYLINYGTYVSDSFVPTESGSATSVEFVAWIPIGNSLTDVNWSIGTTGLDSSDLGSGTVDPTSTFIEGYYGVYDIYTETFNVSGVSLTAGDTYYLTLQDAVADGAAVYWDDNGNYATGYVGYTNSVQPIGSETFDILGTTSSATPEPSSLMLLATGLLGLGVAARTSRRLSARA